MSSLTLGVPADLKIKMGEFPEINWSEVARNAIMQKIQDLQFLRDFKSKSKLTEKDALKLGAQLSRGLTKKYIG